MSLESGSITYRTNCEELTLDKLQGFFVGWPSAPRPRVHLTLLKNSEHVVLACDEHTDRVVGFITAISDGVLAAYIPLLEVLLEYQGQGIGSELLRRMLARLADLYMVDLTCDPERESFYEQLEMKPGTGMRIRNYSAQAGHLPQV